jgi:hypothetical protein
LRAPSLRSRSWAACRTATARPIPDKIPVTNATRCADDGAGSSLHIYKSYDSKKKNTLEEPDEPQTDLD